MEKLGANNANAVHNSIMIQAEMEKLAVSDAEDCAHLDCQITHLFSLLNGTGESINTLINQMASLHDTSDLTTCIDNLSADIDALR